MNAYTSNAGKPINLAYEAQLAHCQQSIKESVYKEIGESLKTELLDKAMTSAERFFKLQDIVAKLKLGHKP